MKVCSLYGAGFYYIPGTDICMKIGGYVRYQLNAGMGNSISFGPFTGTGGFNNRARGQDLGQRVRVTVSQDTRQQTAYGTLRTYLILGWTHDTPANTHGAFGSWRVLQPRFHPDRGLHLRQGDLVLRLRLDRGGGLQRRLRDHV